MIVKEIKGNLLDTEIQHIAHGVNCQNVMGSGVARALYEKWSEVKSEYHKLFNQMEMPMGLDTKYYLGIVHKVTSSDKIIYNLFTQNFYSNRKIRNANYAAIAKCFRRLAEEGIQEIAIPRIGCGLAGGDWNIVKQIINDATLDELDVYVYYL